MNIGTAATASGVSAKMIRHYEMIGLIKSANRTDSGYRVYTANDLETLRFIRRGRDLGFSIEKIRQLMTLWRDPGGASCDVKRIVMEHVVDLEAKMHTLREMADTLRNLATYCPTMVSRSARSFRIWPIPKMSILHRWLSCPNGPAC
ncbi:Transcriptional regulator, MerR family protein [Agrobacterium tumefaciens]|nr:Transcriptional regulator, MerR family protein [Agrobacterium tumefaciens]